MVDVLLDSFGFQRVLQDKLDENGSTDGPRSLGYVCDHHFFNCLHQIVEVRAKEFAVNNGLEALEYMRLSRKIADIGLDYENQCFDLHFGQVGVD